ncbi:MAG: Rpn family recombination-promoting nuclease/putative transposase [Verrucomicrobiales bacterium]|nr:Rpn family recombination-promoting nuclease/putative transposase [Verrucomicrobiales bacterium]
MDESIHQAHDKLFKSSFSDPATAAALLRRQLPETVVAAVDWDSLALRPGTFIDSQYRTSESDLLFSAELVGAGAGDLPCYIYLLLEHVSSRDHYLALKLLRYLVRIWESEVARLEGDRTLRKLPLIIPLVVAQNGERWDLSTRFIDLFALPDRTGEDFAAFVPDFSFGLLQLAEQPFEAIAGTPAGILTLRVLKAERVGELLDDAVWDEELMTLLSQELFERLLRYLLDGDIDRTAFERRINQITQPQIRRAAMTLAEQYIAEGIERGIEKGLEKGLEEGVEKGQKAYILEALEIRFGEVPVGLREVIESLSGEARLRELHRAAIRSASLEEFAREM